MSWIADDPQSFEGQEVDTGQCVAFVEAAAGTPHTALWQCGQLVKDNLIPTGTAIATFDPDGSYGNHIDGRSHAAIFVGQQHDGLLVWDQWKDHSVSQRIIRFGGDKPVNDGNQFHVIELKTNEA